MANIDDLLNTLGGTFGKDRAGAIYDATDFWVQFNKTAADGMASTTTPDTYIWTNPFGISLNIVSGVIVATGAGVTADASNNATITIKSDNGSGGATAIALQAITSVADLNTLTQNVGKAFTTRTGANAILPTNGNLWFNIAKSGTGVVVPVSSFFVRLRRGAANMG